VVRTISGEPTIVRAPRVGIEASIERSDGSPCTSLIVCVMP
jgi:hypothetical protein